MEVRIFQPDIYEKVISVLEEHRPQAVLDVGAGQGYMTKILLDKKFSVTACDGDIKEFSVPEKECFHADFNEALPFNDNIFDCCICIEVIEHIENHGRLIREISRVTKPGGLIIITTPNVLSITSRVHYLVYGYTDCAPLPLNPAAKEYSQHIHPIGIPQLLFYFEKNNVELINLKTNRIRKSSMFLAWIYPLCYMFLYLKLFRKKYSARRALFIKHFKWVLKPENMFGRVTIAIGQKQLGTCSEKIVANYPSLT